MVPLNALGQQRDSDAAQLQPAGPLDPVGTWRCVVYGHPTMGDERVLLNFGPDQSARIARTRDGAIPAWAPLSRWQVDDGVMSFEDSRTGRQFSADLARATLSGGWRTSGRLGGWWCAASDAQDGPGIDILSTIGEEQSEESRKLLIPFIVATPTFPRQAMREALEGTAVVCFVVEPSGEIFNPEFVELSDELFRAPSLDALTRSRAHAMSPGILLRMGARAQRAAASSIGSTTSISQRRQKCR